MKKHLSVFNLIAYSTLYQILGLLMVMAAVEASLFYSRLMQGNTGDSFSLELVIDESRIMWVFAIGFVLMTILLCRTGCEFSTKVGYTFKRLSISERQVYLWQCLYNTLCYVVFWFVEILIVFGLCNLYANLAPAEYVSNQTVFLSFYRNNFLHSLFPMENVGFWIKNIMIVVGMGICSAYFPMAQRNGGKKAEVIVLTCTTIAFFVGGLGEYYAPVMILLSMVLVVGKVIFHLFEKEGEENEVEKDGF